MYKPYKHKQPLIQLVIVKYKMMNKSRQIQYLEMKWQAQGDGTVCKSAD